MTFDDIQRQAERIAELRHDREQTAISIRAKHVERERRALDRPDKHDIRDALSVVCNPGRESLEDEIDDALIAVVLAQHSADPGAMAEAGTGLAEALGRVFDVLAEERTRVAEALAREVEPVE